MQKLIKEDTSDMVLAETKAIVKRLFDLKFEMY